MIAHQLHLSTGQPLYCAGLKEPGNELIEAGSWPIGDKNETGSQQSNGCAAHNQSARCHAAPKELGVLAQQNGYPTNRYEDYRELQGKHGMAGEKGA